MRAVVQRLNKGCTNILSELPKCEVGGSNSSLGKANAAAASLATIGQEA